MPRPRSEHFLRKNINDLVSNATAILKDALEENDRRIAENPYIEDSGLITGVNGIIALLDNLANLKKEDERIFGPEGERVPTEDELQTYAAHCRNCLAGIRGLHEYESNEDVTNADVRDTCSFILGNGADELAAELMPYAKLNLPSRDWKLSAKEKEKADKLVREAGALVGYKFAERARKRSDKLRCKESGWKEYPEFDESLKDYVPYFIPYELQLSGDPNDLAAYYVKEAGHLSKDQKDFLIGRIASLAHIEGVAKNSKERPPRPVFTASSSSDGRKFGLEGYRGKYQFQTSDNGCWSCAYAMLLESRGISLNQQVLRSFRPAAGVEDVKNIFEENVAGLVRDNFYSPFELADLTSKLVPSAALRQVAVTGSGARNRAQVKNILLENVREAIMVHKSPVALNNGVHFVTIVGVDGDKFKVLNSLGSGKNLEETVSIDNFIAVNNRISLTWLHDLEFSKEGRCTNVPQSFEKISYEDGILMSAGNNGDALNLAGNTFVSAKRVAGMTVNDTIYVPDRVPEAVYAPAELNNEHNAPAPDDDDFFLLRDEDEKQPEPGKQTENQPKQQPEPGKRSEKQPEPEKRSEKQKGAPQPVRSIAEDIEEMIAEARGNIVILNNTWQDDDIANPWEAVKFSVASMLACRTLLDAFEHTNDPDREKNFAEIFERRDFIYDVRNSKSFEDFYRDMKLGDLHRLCDCAPEEQKAAVDEFYKKFVDCISKPHVSREEPVAGAGKKGPEDPVPVVTAK